MKWPAINKISFVLQYFCILIVYYRRFFTSGIRALSWARWVEFQEKKFPVMLPSAMSLTVVLLLAEILFIQIRD